MTSRKQFGFIFNEPYAPSIMMSSPILRDLVLPILRLLVLTTFLGFVYLLGGIVYRLTLHPLARYPGPLLGRITDWYSVYQCWKGDRHIDFYFLHQKYGPIVRFGPNRIAVNTNSGLNKIYGIKANTEKSSYYNAFLQVFDGDSSLTTIDPARHAIKKKVVSLALSDSAVASMEDHLLKNIRSFCEGLIDGDQQLDSGSAKDWSSARNMTEWADYLSFDIMGDICFSRSFDMLRKPDNRYMLNVLPEGVKGLNILGHMPGLLKIRLGKLRLGDLFFAGLADDLKRYHAFSKMQSDSRVERGNNVETRDVFSYLLEANDDPKIVGEAFTIPELVGESSLLITGGSDTTATAISSTVFYLLHNSSTLEKAQNEVRPLFNAVEEIRAGSALNSCRYLRACIEEAMRMSPGVPGILPRVALAGGVDIDGVRFPEGTDLGTCHYSIHHNEDYFPDSFSYKPERWIVSEKSGVTAESVALARSAYCPFSIGPRGCVGKGMAMKELMIVLARLLLLYDMKLEEGSTAGEGKPTSTRGRHRKGEFQMLDKFVSKPNGPRVQFKSRA